MPVVVVLIGLVNVSLLALLRVLTMLLDKTSRRIRRRKEDERHTQSNRIIP